MHSTLKRQLQKYFQSQKTISLSDESWKHFVTAISRTYTDYDTDRTLIERSLDLSSKELSAQNQLLEKKSELLSYKVAEIEVEKKRIEAVLASIGEGILAISPTGKIKLVNKVGERLLGLTGTQLYKNNFISMCEDQKVDMDIWTRAKKGNEVTAILEYKKPDKSTLTLSLIINTLFVGSKSLGFIVVIRDVTIEKEIDRIKTEFISIASHQLRTPLSAMKWFSEMLMSGDAGKLSPEQNEFVINIYESTERMIQLVNALLNISRVESGRIQIDPKPLDLKVIINEIVGELNEKITTKKLNVQLEVQSKLSAVSLDPVLIKQIYANLIHNAVKYTDKKGLIKINVKIEKDEIVSSVKDTGYGIPATQQKRLFEKFFRADNISKFDTEGIGLGLYLAKAVVNISGGKMWFKSKENHGTTFWFSLPIGGMKPKKGEVTLDFKL